MEKGIKQTIINMSTKRTRLFPARGLNVTAKQLIMVFMWGKQSSANVSNLNFVTLPLVSGSSLAQSCDCCWQRDSATKKTR